MSEKGPLHPYRVLELGSGDAVAYLGKLFSDFGAEVLKIEPEGGDPRRSQGVEAVPGTAAYQAFLHTNKKSLTADWREASGAQVIRKLLASCDVLIDARTPAEIAGSALDHRALQVADPGLVIMGMSWFGPTGPYRHYKGTEAVARSLAGLVYDTGPLDGVPMLAREGHAAVIAACTAFVPVCAALWNAEAGGRRFSMGILQALSQVIEYDVGMQYDVAKKPRQGVNRFGRSFPAHPMPAKDRYLGVSIMTHGQWLSFCHILGLEELGEDPRFNTVLARQAHQTELEPILEAKLKERTAAEWFELGLEHKIPLAIIPEVQDLKDLSFHRERRSFGTVTIGDRTFDAPILPQQLTATPPIRNGIAPLPGTTTPDDLKSRKRATKNTVAKDLPLKGLRVLDLTMGWAGPLSTRSLADLGADVVKVESCRQPDWFRGLDQRPPFHADRTYEKQHQWIPMNRNKRGTTIDISVPEGRDLVLKLAETADLCVDAYAADAMPKFNLTADVLRERNPRLVVLTMPAFGMNTAWRNGRAYGSTIEHASGIPMVNGRPEDPPAMCHSVFGDAIGGVNAVAAMMVGLLHQKRTGEGQHIDMAQVQAILPLFAETICEYSVTGKVRPRDGNVHPRHYPYGVFACSGTQNFLTVEVRDAEEWRGLCRVMRRPDLGEDASLADVAARRARAAEIDRAIADWAATVKVSIAMNELQVNGVPAGVVKPALDVPWDPHMLAIGRYEVLERDWIGGLLMPVCCYTEGDATKGYPAYMPPPTLGQHNREVLIGELGLSEAEFAALEEAGVIGTEATTERPKPVKWPAQAAE